MFTRPATKSRNVVRQAGENAMEQDGPVTLVIRHLVKRDRQAEFEEWLRGITRAVLQCEGSLGSNVVRPTDPHRLEYVIFLRFDRFANLERWEGSEVRRQWLERVEPLTLQAPTRERHSGLEVWFTPPPGRAQPPRAKMIVVTLLAIYPLILLAQLTLAPLLASWPLVLRTLVTAGLLVCLMTYLAMPLMTRLFATWLYGRPG
jgi:antibiotic biosynthesis monooxygenase (ABM) superfamily enzyme